MTVLLEYILMTALLEYLDPDLFFQIQAAEKWSGRTMGSGPDCSVHKITHSGIVFRWLMMCHC